MGDAWEKLFEVIEPGFKPGQLVIINGHTVKFTYDDNSISILVWHGPSKSWRFSDGHRTDHATQTGMYDRY